MLCHNHASGSSLFHCPHDNVHNHTHETNKHQHCLQAEPTFGSQVWRTLRTLGGAFILVTCLGTLMDDKGLTKSFMNNPDLKPQLVSNTKFADVKGVDEAKVSAALSCVKTMHVSTNQAQLD